MANPRVEHPVQQVDEEVCEQIYQHEAGHRTDHRDTVALVDRPVDVIADPVDVEDALGDDGTTHKGTEVIPDEGDHGDEGVAQGVHSHDP